MNTLVKVPECRICHAPLTSDNWRNGERNANNRICAECGRRGERIRMRARYVPHARKKRARRPMNENRQCTLFLGVHVAERVLSKVFKNVVRMPHRNPGYDFICAHGKKIDVKSSCLNKDKRWKFKIRHNDVPDFFLMIAFNNRRTLTPKYVWLIPKYDICHAAGVSIAPSTVGKWDKYQLDIGKVVDCCKTMQSQKTRLLLE